MADAKTGGNIRLSRRLQMLADMVTPGNVAADVGCDHGFLSIRLIEAGISPRAIASDVRPGPLAAARTHIAERGLSAYIETRLSDGLAAYRPGEAQTLICAGMGGRLMQRILTQGADVAESFTELILQPQSELWQFRVFLRERGFVTLAEEILREDGKYYFFFRARPGDGKCGESAPDGGFAEGGKPAPDGSSAEEEARLGDKYGAGLLSRRHPVLREYLERKLAECEAVNRTLKAHRETAAAGSRVERSLAENEAELADLRAALALYREQGDI
ncbi:MAG: class I SAM-dependent methyltransferase [Clostridium sp.]|nr:class I SAM-dependent methyltransferase [Acetatifactor muris]MCM1527367.1 class I SAM-dependent methyltransferase [Bacteroides sp.]MCM1563569.1 class I SAM-dependent methyltransferase [Clostridium sp.]